jgi:hypothetical protein
VVGYRLQPLPQNERYSRYGREGEENITHLAGLSPDELTSNLTEH